MTPPPVCSRVGKASARPLSGESLFRDVHALRPQSMIRIQEKKDSDSSSKIAGIAQRVPLNITVYQKMKSRVTQRGRIHRLLPERGRPTSATMRGHRSQRNLAASTTAKSCHPFKVRRLVE